MAITRYGLGGPATAYGAMADKSAGGAAAQSPRPSRYRGGHRVTHYHPILWWVGWLWRVWS